MSASVVAVGSGKGGVGKSTISLNLAVALAEGSAKVGLLDADFYGPDIPLMVGLTRKVRLRSWTLWQHRDRGALRFEPVERYGVKIMSVGFFLAEDQAFTWPGQMAHFVGRQLVHDVDWGELDYLIVDLPPGTADVQQQLLELLPLSGVVVVVGPQDVAHLDAKKVLDMLAAADVRLLGGVENMSALVCPHCEQLVEVFPPVREDRSIWSLGVPRLGRIPLDPAVAEAGDGGKPVVASAPSGGQAGAFRELAAAVVTRLSERGDA